MKKLALPLTTLIAGMILIATPSAFGHLLIAGDDAMFFIQTFVDSGVPQVHIQDNPNGYFLVDNIACVVNLRKDLKSSDILAGIPGYTCTAEVDSKPVVIHDAHRMYDMSLDFKDPKSCPTVGCKIEFKSIGCVIQPDKEKPSERFMCALTDKEQDPPSGPTATIQ